MNTMKNIRRVAVNLACAIAVVGIGACTTVDTVRRESAEMDRSYVPVGTYKLFQGNAAISESLFVKATNSDGKWRVEVSSRPYQRENANEEIFAVNSANRVIKPSFERVSTGTAGPVPTPSEHISCGLAGVVGPKSKYTVCNSNFSTGGAAVDWAKMAAMLVEAGAQSTVDQYLASLAEIEKINAARREANEKQKELALLSAQLKTINGWKELPVGTVLQCTVGLSMNIVCSDSNVAVDLRNFFYAGDWKLINSSYGGGNAVTMVYKKMAKR
ncbi:hypothetical protein [Cupriavidus campinensis]|uniref:hypothetical protein n=1 Tax=Cupriavidus campinensis TaxID=151783 RepID=UPI0011EEFB4F|nr:hypothetical protein [Cupriavidus campinensis]